MDVNERMTLSSGESVVRREIDRLTERRFQRAVSRKKLGSKSRRKTVMALDNAKRRNGVRNRNECRRITTDIVRKYGLIAVEDSNIVEATRAGGADKKGMNGMNREILAQGWGIIRDQLGCKAEWAGRQLVKMNPSCTSRICSACGFVNGKARKCRTLGCSECGHVGDRDIKAARNILKRGWESAAGSATGGLPPVLPETYAGY